jgi:tetratricopeptide (TPR) repeat protein
MNQLAAPLAVALDHHQSGRFAEAEAGYQHVLGKQPDHVDALHYMGVLLHQRGDNEGAAKLLDRALSLALDASACWSNRGLVAAAQDDLTLAVECYERALSIDPDFENARNNLGVALQKQMRFDEAIGQYETLIAQSPGNLEARSNLGVTLASAKRYEDALAVYRETLARYPDHATARFGAANALREIKRYDEAVAELKLVLAQRPDHFEAWVNLGTSLGFSGHFEEAEQAYRTALTLRDDPKIHVCVGAAIGSQGKFLEEEAYYLHALDMQPDLADAKHNLALLSLRRGEFEKGWALHEIRWSSSKYVKPVVPGVAEWKGESLDGRTLLLVGEQGHGDQIQFARYATALAGMGAIVDMWVPEAIVELVRSVKGVRNVFSTGSSLGYDFWAPTMSVAHHLSKTLPEPLADVPYMSVSSERVGTWPGRVSRLARKRRKIGIVWAGSPTFGNDQFRSMPLSAFAPLADIPKTAWFSLQKGPAREQLTAGEPPMKLYDLTDKLQSFADTAALIEQLDLVITVDTAVAHVAGAIGKPVWLLLPANWDWRWMMNRDDSPWYPSARLFKQTRLGHWDEPIAAVKAALLNESASS